METICTLCNIDYSNRRSFLSHKRRFHKSYLIDNNRRKNEENNCYSCQYCKKEYTIAKSRWAHEQTCKLIEPVTESPQNIELHNRIQNLQNEMIRQKEETDKQIKELQNKLLKSSRLDNKTFKAVNKILMDRSYNNSLNNNTNSNNTVNNTYQILALGNEEMANVLTFRQKKMIMDSRLCSIEKIVEIAHCGEMNQYKNIIITNLKDNFAYRYDETKGYFITVSKAYLLDDVINHRMMDIEAIYDELKTANRIDEKTKELIQRFLDKMESTDEPFYDNEIKYENFKSFKTDKIKILLYNNQDKITKDIALLISDEIPQINVKKAATAAVAEAQPDTIQFQEVQPEEASLDTA